MCTGKSCFPLLKISSISTAEYLGWRITYLCGHYYDICRPHQWCTFPPSDPDNFCPEYIICHFIDKRSLRDYDCHECRWLRNEADDRERVRIAKFFKNLSPSSVEKADSPSSKTSYKSAPAVPTASNSQSNLLEPPISVSTYKMDSLAKNAEMANDGSSWKIDEPYSTIPEDPHSRSSQPKPAKSVSDHKKPRMKPAKMEATEPAPGLLGKVLGFVLSIILLYATVALLVALCSHLARTVGIRSKANALQNEPKWDFPMRRFEAMDTTPEYDRKYDHEQELDGWRQIDQMLREAYEASTEREARTRRQRYKIGL